MCLCMCACACACVCRRIYKYTHIMHAHTHACAGAHARAYIHTHLNARANAHTLMHHSSTTYTQTIKIFSVFDDFPHSFSFECVTFKCYKYMTLPFVVFYRRTRRFTFQLLMLLIACLLLERRTEAQLAEDQSVTHVTILSETPAHFAGTSDHLIVRSNLQVNDKDINHRPPPLNIR